MRRLLALGVALLAAGGALWLTHPAADGWRELGPGVWRSPGLPFGYALVADGRAVLIDAPAAVAGSLPPGVRQVEAVWLTHHHRDSVAAAERFLSDKVPVRAAKASAEWLTPAGVAKYWQESLPLRNSRTAYFVVPVGLDGIDCSLDDGQSLAWRGWTVQVVGTPGHSRDHLGFLATRD